MMHRLITLLLSLAGVLALTAATQPIYINNSPNTNAPQIDATAFVNTSTFTVSSPFFGNIPYQTLNTLYFTNTLSGVMSSTPGFRFDFFTNNSRFPMASWVNRGSIFGSTWLLVSSSNIVSTGPLGAG